MVRDLCAFLAMAGFFAAFTIWVPALIDTLAR
jgi:hypothetical protein